MQDLTQDPRYREARRHARKLRGFYTHLLVFAAVNLGLFVLDMLGNPGRLWFGWPLAGWGLGVACHGLSVFAFHGGFGREWEERAIRRYLDSRR
jgi:hypothetical protein